MVRVGSLCFSSEWKARALSIIMVIGLGCWIGYERVMSPSLKTLVFLLGFCAPVVYIEK